MQIFKPKLIESKNLSIDYGISSFLNAYFFKFCNWQNHIFHKEASCYFSFDLFRKSYGTSKMYS